MSPPGNPGSGADGPAGTSSAHDLLEQSGVKAPLPEPDAYAVVPDATSLPTVMRAVEALRAAGVAVQMHAGGGSMKSQFKKADASGARFALIFGADELAQAQVALKPLREPAQAQTVRSLTDPAAWAHELRTS